MALNSLSNLLQNRQPPGCKIIIGRKEVTKLYPFITTVRIDTARDRASTAVLSIMAPDGKKRGAQIDEDGKVRIGDKITIKAVFGRDSEPIPVFYGYITKINHGYPNDRGGTKVTVECQDETVLLDQSHERLTLETPNTFSDGRIVQKLLSKYTLIAHFKNKDGITSENIVQSGSDIEFIRRRARINGFELYSWNGMIYFGPMRLEDRPQAPILVYAGHKTNCINFDVSNDVRAPEKFSYDITPRKGKKAERFVKKSNLKLMGTLSAKADDAAIGVSEWFFSRTKTPNKIEAASMAQAIANKEAMRVVATGELDGLLYGHVLRIGKPVTVIGAGKINSGKYYVDTVTHNMTHGQYRQSFSLIRNAIGDDTKSTKRRTDLVMGL